MHVSSCLEGHSVGIKVTKEDSPTMQGRSVSVKGVALHSSNGMDVVKHTASLANRKGSGQIRTGCS